MSSHFIAASAPPRRAPPFAGGLALQALQQREQFGAREVVGALARDHDEVEIAGEVLLFEPERLAQHALLVAAHGTAVVLAHRQAESRLRGAGRHGIAAEALAAEAGHQLHCPAARRPRW